MPPVANPRSRRNRRAGDGIHPAPGSLRRVLARLKRELANPFLAGAVGVFVTFPAFAPEKPKRGM